MAPLGSNREDHVIDVGSHDEMDSEPGLPLRLEQAQAPAQAEQAPASSSGPESIHLHDVWRPDMGKNLSHTHRGCHPTQSWIWILNFLIAISVAVCSQLVHYGMENLGDLRMYLIDLVLPHVLGAWAINFLTCMVFVAIACKCVEWQPSSISSGIPGVIAFLNGVDLEESLFSFGVLVAKVVGVICACGSSLAVGPEGPMIHIGAAIGVLVCNCLEQIKCLDGIHPSRGGSRSIQLHAAAVGAGCGVAAAFEAPFAGTLFVVEEAATYLSQRFFIHVFSACCLSLSVVLLAIQPAWERLWQAPTWQFTPLFQVFIGPNCSHTAPGFFLTCGLIGVVCGLFGSVFNQIILEWNFRRASWRARGVHRGRLRCELLVLTAVSCSVEIFLPALWHCHESTLQHAFENSNQCISGEWAAQMFKSKEDLAKNVREAKNSKMEPAPGLFGIQYNPSECPKAIFANRTERPNLPECNLEKMGLVFPPSVPEQEKYFYCCGFDNISNFYDGKIYNYRQPKAPLQLYREMWPSFGIECQPTVWDNISIPQYNPMAALALVPDRITVKNLFTRGSPNMLQNGAMFAYLLCYFLLAAATSGSAVPSGLVVPMMLIGGCIGRMSGNILTSLFPDAYECPVGWTHEYQNILSMLTKNGVHFLPQTCGLPDPGSFALVGAAAFMSGSGSIVLFVIAVLVEITGDTSSIVPIAIAAITGRFVARIFIGHGLYHDLMQVPNLPFLPPQCPLPARLRVAPVSELPGGRVQLRQLKPIETREELQTLLTDCGHQAFPVVSEGHLLGLVRRIELEEWLAQNEQSALHLEEVADVAPYIVDLDFPVERAYFMFRELGLRQLVVTDAGCPVGILTRRSFLPQ